MDNWFPNELPYMFDSWDEYRDHLLEHIIKEELKPAFRKKFKKFDKAFHETPVYIKAMKCCIKALLINDYHSTIMGNFLRSPFIYQFNRTRVITGYQDAKK